MPCQAEGEIVVYTAAAAAGNVENQSILAPHRLGHTFAQAGVEALKHLGGGQGEVVLVF